jgi:hypothetical protein
MNYLVLSSPQKEQPEDSGFNDAKTREYKIETMFKLSFNSFFFYFKRELVSTPRKKKKKDVNDAATLGETLQNG